MKKNCNSVIKFSSLLLVIYTINSSLFAQTGRVSKGYIIKSNDTIRGEIRVSNSRHLFQKVSFRSSSSVSFSSYSPVEVPQFYVEGIGRFVSKDDIKVLSKGATKDIPYYFQILEDGRAILYLVSDYYKKDHYFIEKNNVVKELEYFTEITTNEKGEQIKLTKEKFLITLREFLSDCPIELNFKVNFSEQQLKKIVSKYNESFNTTHESKKVHYSIKEIGIVVSQSFNNSTLETSTRLIMLGPLGSYVDFFPFNGRSYSYSNLHVGVASEIYIGRNRHISFLGQVIYANRSVSNEDFSMTTKSLEVPLSLKYKIGLGLPIHPYLGIGLVIPTFSKGEMIFSDLPLYNSSRDPIKDQDGNHVFSSINATNSLEIGAIRPRVTAFLGLETSLTKKSTLAIQIRYESVNQSKAYFTFETVFKILEIRYSFRLGQ